MQRGDAINTKRRFHYLLWLVWVIWLPFLVLPVGELIQSHLEPPRLIVTLMGTILFVGVYLAATWRNASHLIATPASLSRPDAQPDAQPATTWITIGVCVGLSVALVLLGRRDVWLDPFIFTSAYVGSSLPIVQAVPVLGTLLICIAVAGQLAHLTWFDLGPALVFVIVVGITNMGLVRSIVASRELRAARQEIAHLAVANERLRIARDLHDLLGHNLSLIALKSELAGRLIRTAPERAAAEIDDVSHAARTTLQEVRDAVMRYRQPSLSAELNGSREILAAAGIACEYEGDEHVADGLPSTSEAGLAWAVREGVTNVIRHSHARRCTIRLTRDEHDAQVEIIDDGNRDLTSILSIPLESVVNAGDVGNGLAGLKERMTALGGRCDALTCADGGFRLAVSVPRTGRGYKS